MSQGKKNLRLEHVAKEIYKQAYKSLSDADQIEVREDNEEIYLAHIFLRQSGKQHNKLRTDLSNDYGIGVDRYPKTRQATLHLLDK